MADPTPTPPPTAPTTNPIVSTIDEVVQALIYGLGVNAAMAAIIAEVPFLGFPVIKQLVNWVVTQIANLIYKYLDLFVDFSVVDFQTQQEADNYLAAVSNLQAALATGDVNAIGAAKTAFTTNLQALVGLDGF